MRIIINCTGGSIHSMMLLGHTTVLDVKQYVSDKEGIPVSNQALLFAGRHLGPDSALLLDELQLDSYSLAHEVVVYMQPQLVQQMNVYLCARPGSADCRMFAEAVEAASSLANIQGLLLQRQLACMPFPAPAAAVLGCAEADQTCASKKQQERGAGSHGSSSSSRIASGSSSVVVKRRDGSCCSKVHVDEASSIQELLQAIWEAEGQSPTTLSFYQAQDGCLHAMYGAAADSAE